MLIVTPNPAVDHTVRLERLRPGEVIRTGAGVSVAGGKGGNVARAARCLGTEAPVVAFVPETGADHLTSLYAAEGLELRGVAVPGRVRTCTAMVEADGRVTLLNEPGADVTDADWARLLDAVRAAAGAGSESGAGSGSGSGAGPGAGSGSGAGSGAGSGTGGGSGTGSVIVCSGSLPPGAPADGYARIVTLGHDTGREVLVDAARAPLVHAVHAGADLVCPNLSEAEVAIASMTQPAGDAQASAAELVHEDGEDVPQRARQAAAQLRRLGAGWAVVTAGSAGAAACGPGFEAWLPAPAVTVRNPIGAGDSLVAGLATARSAGASWPDAIRRGLASGSASVEQDRAGIVDPARVDELAALLV